MLRGGAVGWLLSLLIWSLPGLGWGQSAPLSDHDQAELYMGAPHCGECHKDAFAVWEKTTHATGFKKMHGKDSAKAIAKKLDIRLIRQDSPCLKCHYTPVLNRGRLSAASGASCESCHGPGRDWVNIHNDYGGKGVEKETETADHRVKRIEQSRKAGMRRPSDLYATAERCFQCHLVPNERLVNVGGHSTGSGKFEFVKWSQGEIRHNFLQAMITKVSVNAERSSERKRVMYVVGRALDLEYTLRGVAAATERGVYLKAMERRFKSALREWGEINARIHLPEIEAIQSTAGKVPIDLNNRGNILKAADKIAEETKRFIDKHDGARFASLDPLILETDDSGETGESHPAVSAGSPELSRIEREEVPQPLGQSNAGKEPSGKTDPTLPAAKEPKKAESGTSPPQAHKVIGEIKTSIRPKSSHKTLGRDVCSRCHGPQNNWWQENRHSGTAEPFFDKKEKNLKIARLYGMHPNDIAKGSQLCMDCHGTIVSGKEKKEVEDGVSCESCHGASEGFLKPHEEGDKKLGEKRPGYVKGLNLGMADLRNQAVRAVTCSNCHYITEPRLLSAGHPSGEKFNYVKAMEKTKHWEHPPEPSDVLQKAYEEVIARRGGVPKVAPPAVEVASDAGESPVSGPPTPSGTAQQPPTRPSGGTTAPPVIQAGGGRPLFPTMEPIRPAQSPENQKEIQMPPFPEVNENATVEEILLVIKERLDLLYRELYQKP